MWTGALFVRVGYRLSGWSVDDRRGVLGGSVSAGSSSRSGWRRLGDALLVDRPGGIRRVGVTRRAVEGGPSRGRGDRGRERSSAGAPRVAVSVAGKKTPGSLSRRTAPGGVASAVSGAGRSTTAAATTGGSMTASGRAVSTVAGATGPAASPATGSPSTMGVAVAGASAGPQHPSGRRAQQQSQDHDQPLPESRRHEANLLLSACW